MTTVVQEFCKYLYTSHMGKKDVSGFAEIYISYKQRDGRSKAGQFWIGTESKSEVFAPLDRLWASRKFMLNK